MSLHPDQERYVSLATFRRDGTEVRTPVWIASSDGAPLVYTNRDSWKVKRIRNNPKVRLAACSMRGDVHGPWMDATARIVEDEAGRDRGIGAFLKKYGWQMRLALFLSRLSGRYDDRTIIELQY